MNFFCSDKRKTLAEIKFHLPAKKTAGACACPIWPIKHPLLKWYQEATDSFALFNKAF